MNQSYAILGAAFLLTVGLLNHSAKAFSTPTKTMHYQDAIESVWHPTSLVACQDPEKISTPESESESKMKLLKELVRYASLAPSSHNTQCWKFEASEDGMSLTILPDLERRCPVVDPDDHHLYISLGCALENLVIAAAAFGLESRVDSTDPENEIHVHFLPASSSTTETTAALFEAIPKRQVSRTEYNGEPLTDEELVVLRRAAMGDGVEALFLVDHESQKVVEDHVTHANSAQIRNTAFVRELLSWIRFGEQESVNSGDGLAGAAMGSPFIPRWIGQIFFMLMFRTTPENDKIRRQIRSSAGTVVFASQKENASQWIEVGRAYERFALQATLLGVRNAMLNQPAEEADERHKFAKAVGVEGKRPDLIVRFGKGGAELPHSLRRPVEDIFVLP